MESHEWLDTKRDIKLEKLAKQIAQELTPVETIIITNGYVEKVSLEWGEPIEVSP